MLKKANTRKLMKTLYRLFIMIRFEPENPIHKDMIKAFQHQVNKPNYYNIKSLVIEVDIMKDFHYKTSMLNELKKFELKINKFTMNRIHRSIPVIQDILEELLKKLVDKEFDKAKIMASSVHNYPDFLIFEYKWRSEDFWEDHIQYFKRVSGENFLEQWKYLFNNFYLNH